MDTLAPYLIKGAPRGIDPRGDVQDMPPDSLLDAWNVDVTHPHNAISRRPGTRRFSSTKTPIGNTSYDHTARILRLFWWRRSSGDRLLVAIVRVSAPSDWTVDTAYVAGQYASPTTANDYVYECTTAGTSHAVTEPTWPTTLGETIADGTATWTCRSEDLAEVHYNDPYDNNDFTKALKDGVAATGQFPVGNTYPAISVLNDRMFIATGVDDSISNVAFNGTSINTNVGLDAPDDAPTLAAQAGGSVDVGSREYVYTFYNSITGTESTESAGNSINTTDANRTVRISACTALPTDADTYRVYRRGLGGSVYRLILETQTNLNTGNEDDVLADVHLGYDTPPTYGGPPPTTKFCTAHKSRMLWAYKTDTSGTVEPNVIYISEPGYPAMADPMSSIAVRRDDGDEITGMATIFETVYVFKRHHVYLLSEDPQLLYRAESILTDGPVGTISPGTIVSVEGQVFYLSEQGIVGLTGREIKSVVPDPSTFRRNAMHQRLHFEWTNMDGLDYTVYLGLSDTTYTCYTYWPPAIETWVPNGLYDGGVAPGGLTKFVRPTKGVCDWFYYTIGDGVSGGTEPEWSRVYGGETDDTTPPSGTITWTTGWGPDNVFYINGRRLTTGNFTVADGATVSIDCESYAVPLSFADTTLSVRLLSDNGLLATLSPDTPEGGYVEEPRKQFELSINWDLAAEFFAINVPTRDEYWCYVASNDSEYIDTILIYNYRTGAFSRHTCFASSACFTEPVEMGTDTSVRSYPLMGDYDGVVWQGLDEGNIERDLAEGTLRANSGTGAITFSHPSWTLTDAGAVFPTAGTDVTGLRGTTVLLTDANGFRYTGIITANDATTLTVRNWLLGRYPFPGSFTYYIGGMDANFVTPWLDLNNPEDVKQVKQILVFCEQRGDNVEIEMRFSDTADAIDAPSWATWRRYTTDFSPTDNPFARLPVTGGRCRYVSMRIGNFAADDPFIVQSYGLKYIKTGAKS